MGNKVCRITSLRAEGIFFCFRENANVELRPLGETVTLDWSPKRQNANKLKKLLMSLEIEMMEIICIRRPSFPHICYYNFIVSFILI